MGPPPRFPPPIPPIPPPPLSPELYPKHIFVPWGDVICGRHVNKTPKVKRGFTQFAAFRDLWIRT